MTINSTRYAIQGGLAEAAAYEISDKFILDIDKAKSTAQIVQSIIKIITKITLLVQSEKKKPRHSPYVNKCILYVDKHLNSKITVSDIAKKCSISPDYLSQIFKKEMGENLSAYILRQKLEAAQTVMFVYSFIYGRKCRIF